MTDDTAEQTITEALRQAQQGAERAGLPTRLISTGTTEEALLAAVSYLFPNLSPAELSAAL